MLSPFFGVVPRQVFQYAFKVLLVHRATSGSFTFIIWVCFLPPILASSGQMFFCQALSGPPVGDGNRKFDSNHTRWWWVVHRLYVYHKGHYFFWREVSKTRAQKSRNSMLLCWPGIKRCRIGRAQGKLLLRIPGLGPICRKEQRVYNARIIFGGINLLFLNGPRNRVWDQSYCSFI